MPAWTSDEKAVRLSVCQTCALLQNLRKICPDFYTTQKIILTSFLKKEWLVVGDPFYLKFWVNRPMLEWNWQFNTNRKSTLRDFQWT